MDPEYDPDVSINMERPSSPGTYDTTASGGIASTEQLIRPAGLLERFAIHREQLGLYGPLIATGTYRTYNLQAPGLTESTLIKILKHCIIQHNVLSTVIRQAENEGPQIARVFSLDLTRHYRILDTAEPDDKIIRELLEQIHNNPLDPNHPQWRVYVQSLSSMPTNHFRLYFAFSHALADGRSGSIFHRTFLQALCMAQDLPFDSHLGFTLPTDFNLAPELERTAKFTISESFLRSVTHPEKSQPASRSFNTVWCGSTTGYEQTGENCSPTALEVFRISPKVVKDTLDACRMHNSKMTGLLTHFVALAVSRALRVRGCSHDGLAVDTSFDMRRAINRGLNTIANYASTTKEVVDTKPENFDQDEKMSEEDWETVKHRTRILGERASSLADHPPMLLKYLKSQRDWIWREAKSPSNSFAICNIGVLDANADVANSDDWNINDMLFSQSSNITTAPLMFNIASSKRGPMTIVVSWWPGLLGIEDERSFVREIGLDITRRFESLSRLAKATTAPTNLLVIRKTDNVLSCNTKQHQDSRAQEQIYLAGSRTDNTLT